jgi:selenocysteine lyase/cysteine desulfurase
MNAALETLLGFDMEAVEEQILGLTSILTDCVRSSNSLELLSPEAEKDRAGIVTASVSPGKDPDIVFSRLADAGVVVAVREGKLRLSPHFYNSRDDMLRTAELLSHVMERT